MLSKRIAREIYRIQIIAPFKNGVAGPRDQRVIALPAEQAVIAATAGQHRVLIGNAALLEQHQVATAELEAPMRAQAERGVAGAQHSLGFMYFNGQGIEQSYALALHWYGMAAAQGLEHAQYNLGVMCQKGQGVAQDFAQAAHWYQQAAEQGYAAAQYNLGWLYAKRRPHLCWRRCRRHQ